MLGLVCVDNGPGSPNVIDAGDGSIEKNPIGTPMTTVMDGMSCRTGQLIDDLIDGISVRHERDTIVSPAMAFLERRHESSYSLEKHVVSFKGTIMPSVWVHIFRQLKVGESLREVIFAWAWYSNQVAVLIIIAKTIFLE